MGCTQGYNPRPDHQPTASSSTELNISTSGSREWLRTEHPPRPGEIWCQLHMYLMHLMLQGYVILGFCWNLNFCRCHYWLLIWLFLWSGLRTLKRFAPGSLFGRDGGLLKDARGSGPIFCHDVCIQKGQILGKNTSHTLKGSENQLVQTWKPKKKIFQ